MKPIQPTKLHGGQFSALQAPLIAGLVALRLGRADSEHYHDLGYAMTLASVIPDMVQRHKHLAEPIKEAHNALNAIFQRAKQRTVQDAPWNGTAEEVDAIENGVNVYLAMLKTTPAKTMRRAIERTAKLIRSSSKSSD